MDCLPFRSHLDPRPAHLRHIHHGGEHGRLIDTCDIGAIQITAGADITAVSDSWAARDVV